jgi:hypothetical protein
VSKRRDSRYRSGRSPHWIKSKNPDAPAVRREAEEDWSPVTQEFASQKSLNAEQNDLAYEYEYTPAFAKWQGLLSPEQYEIAEVRTGAARSDPSSPKGNLMKVGALKLGYQKRF